MLKVNLIVVSGKPEGKVIPLTAPIFRIGRDETCHLRPNSVEVSRRHTEITVTDTTVVVMDLGSRNGTLVNGQLITAPHRLKSGELLKVGPLTFAVSILETALAVANSNPDSSGPVRPTLESTPQSQIESWLVADNARPTPDRPSGVYDGDTLTIDSYTGLGGQIPGRPGTKPAPAPEVAKGAFDDDSLEFEQLSEGNGDVDEETGEPVTDGGEEDSGIAAEALDESNPFFIPKKQAAVVTEDSKKKDYADTSDAANDILRRMIDRRRASRS